MGLQQIKMHFNCTYMNLLRPTIDRYEVYGENIWVKRVVFDFYKVGK